MKRVYNYILLSVFAFAAAGCLEDELNPGGELVGSGDEVQFGLSLNDPKTKTVYGEEYTNDANKKVFPIYWSEGDKIQIASPQCVTGRNQAEYLVTPEAGQSYALAMTTTGDYGVQWGNEESADFYSIYPSNGTSWPTLTAGNVEAKLNIASEQSANLVLTPAVTKESTIDGKTVTEIVTPGVYQGADMGNVIMYAQTSADRGDVVKLNYKPYSTILEFELGIAQNTDTQGNKLPDWGTVKVVSMSLTAPTGTNIVGDFSLTFNGNTAPTIAAAGNNSNAINMVFETQPLLNETNRTLKAKFAMIPISGVTTLDEWKVSINVLKGTDTETTTYTKTIKGTEATTALAPGKIHKITLPKFSEVEAWNPEIDAWIPTLEDYKNIYLTELSLPGAWYAGAPTDENYQSTASISDLWDAGVRAFAVECRSGYSSLLSSSMNRVLISGTGSNTGDRYWGGTRISTVISNIANAVAGSVTTENGVTDGEYAVLVLSYADGGKAGQNSTAWNYFINGVKNEIATSGATNIYDKEVTANTTIADVLGKLIIKINVDDNLTKSSYDNSANMLLSYNPFMQQLPEDTFVNEDGTETSRVDYTKLRYSKIYWKTWENTYKDFTANNTTDFLWCFASANRTQLDTGTDTSIPTYKQRKAALRSMIQQSKQIANSKKHNVWFYFNAGGTQATSVTDTKASPTTFATNMNAWLLDVIKLKANGGIDKDGNYTGTVGTVLESNPSSLGLVFFNHCTNQTYHGPEIIKEIIEMNNKFKLQRATQTPRSAAPSYSSGMNDSDVAAFGWD